MVGFKSKNQESQEVKQLVVIILIWGGKNPTKKKPNKKKPKSTTKTNQPTKPEGSLVNPLCCSQPSPTDIVLQIFNYIVQLDSLQTLNTLLCL